VLTRRRLVQASTLSVFAMGLRPSLAFARRRRRSDELRVAVAGIRSRGRQHIEGFHRLEGVRVVALCDVDANVLGARVKEFEERGETVDAVTDFRRLLDRDDVDAVSIATPNHWHALQAVWACQAGKDVYVEKPVSHDLWEGTRIVKAARKHGRLVQTGTQSRSSAAVREAIAWLHGGGLGAITVARGFCYKPRMSIGKVDGPQPVPEGVDYELWTGPAPMQPLMRRSLHYDWHWVNTTGNGDIGNQGIHQMDLARWALGADGLPRTSWSVGGRLGYDDDGDTPNTQVVVHDWGAGRPRLIFEVRGLPRDAAAQTEGWNGGEMDDYRGTQIGIVVEAEKGWLQITSDYGRAVAFDLEGNELQRWEGGGDHFANFVAAVRSRRREDLSADIAEGHLSSAMCHMGNVSHLTGAPVAFGAVREAVAGDALAAEAVGRMVAHLQANGVDLEKTPLVLGSRVHLDPTGAGFTEPAANALARRAGRPPFVFPDEV
jgi:predicted dehydrogenase